MGLGYHLPEFSRWQLHDLWRRVKGKRKGAFDGNRENYAMECTNHSCTVTCNSFLARLSARGAKLTSRTSPCHRATLVFVLGRVLSLSYSAVPMPRLCACCSSNKFERHLCK